MMRFLRGNDGAPSRTRTCNLWLRRPGAYQNHSINRQRIEASTKASTRRAFLGALVGATPIAVSPVRGSADDVCPICKGDKFEDLGPTVFGRIIDGERENIVLRRDLLLQRCRTCSYLRAVPVEHI